MDRLALSHRPARVLPRHARARLFIGVLAVLAGTAMPMPSALAQPTSPASSRTPAPTAPSADLPVSKITLYRSGVGYFERQGRVDGNAEVQLRFSTDQINDILKSMILLDLDGGRIDSVSYGSKEPLAKRLASFGINIADNPSSGEILQRLRGTPVLLTTPSGEISGTIMNVEKRSTVLPGAASAPANVAELPWINLVTDKGVRSVDLTTVTGFQILDKALAEELNKALSALAEYRADRTKTVDLRFSGQGARRVVVGYVHEMPVWKTSYRLVLPDVDPPAGDPKKGQVVIQGWAMVENTTDQDWNNVKLGLVSGRPVSFQMDLYEPLYAFRPSVPVPTVPGVSPRIYALGVDREEQAERMATGRSTEGIYGNVMQSQATLNDARRVIAGAPGAPAPARSGLFRADMDAAAYKSISTEDLTKYAPGSAATGQSVGEIFQYEVDLPVSIERQRSAMIPIITANCTGRRVSIFNVADGSQFPMRGVEITNDTGLQFLPGPISVLDSGAYAGDAQIGQIPKNDKRLLAYALDLDVAVLTTPETESSITKLTIVDGLVRQQIKERRKTTYEFSSKDSKRGRTIILEHTKLPGFELVETEKPSEQAQDLYRFTLALDASKAQKFSVTQEQIRADSIQVVSFDMPTIVSYHKAGKLSDAVLDAFRSVAAKRSAINATEREIAQQEELSKEISDEQGRIRENMTRIDRNSPLYQRYMTKLTDQETQLEDLRGKRDAAQKTLETQRGELNEFIRTLNVQ